MVSAVAVGSVVLGDKDDKERTDALNETSHMDLAELEGRRRRHRRPFAFAPLPRSQMGLADCSATSGCSRRAAEQR